MWTPGSGIHAGRCGAKPRRRRSGCLTFFFIYYFISFLWVGWVLGWERRDDEMVRLHGSCKIKLIDAPDGIPVAFLFSLWFASIDKDHHLSLLPINTKGYILFLSFLTKDQSS